MLSAALEDSMRVGIQYSTADSIPGCVCNAWTTLAVALQNIIATVFFVARSYTHAVVSLHALPVSACRHKLEV